MRASAAAAMVCLGVVARTPAARAQDWTTGGYDAQRSSWVRAEGKISAASLQKPGFQLLWKLKLDDESTAGLVTPPVLLSLVIGYRGFRALGFVGARSDHVVAIDTDLGRVEWERRLSPGAPSPGGSPACAREMTPNLARPTNAALPDLIGGAGRASRAGQPARGAVGDPGEGAVTLAQLEARRREAQRAAPVPPKSAGPRTSPHPFPILYALSSDGMLRALNVMNGADAEPPVPFLPPHADARGLIVVDDVAYVATTRGCGGAPDGVWSLDLGSKQVTKWRSSGGPAFISSPVIFAHQGRLLVAASSRDGRIRLLDSRHSSFIRMPLSSHTAATAADALASWADTDDTRWLVQAAVPSGAIVTWKVVHRDSMPTLQPGWVARDIPAPLAPAVVNGVIFAISRGARPASPAVLFALDGATGREMWNSGTTIPPVVRAGLSAGGSQVYVATGDGTLYAFGFPMEH